MIATIALATALSNCPKPAIHHRHKAPIASCVAEEPRTILLPAPADDLEPVALPVLTKYNIIEIIPEPISINCSAASDWSWPTTGGIMGGTSRAIHAAKAPEIDPAGALPALTLLAGAICCIKGRSTSIKERNE